MVVASHVYVDLDIVNNDMTSDVSAPSLRFQETRSAPYIEGDSAYYLCSNTRFSIQTGTSLPVFIPLRQTDVDKTVYAITLKITGSNGGQSNQFTQHIKYYKIDDTAPAPAQPIEKQDITSTC